MAARSEQLNVGGRRLVTSVAVLRLPRLLVSRFRLLSPRTRDALAVFGLAIALRLVFSALMANTYDEDEFVYLALGRDLAHGAIPYRDFPFFHPPGILVVLQFLDPLTSVWWPLTRLVNVLIDSVTAVLVWRVASHLYGRREALSAGILYAVSPVVLVSSVRVDQEIIMTALAMVGVTLLVTRNSLKTALLAGACLALACWIKYPMIVFLPVFVLLSPGRKRATLFGFLAAIVLLFLPYLGEIRQLYQDTISWQLISRQTTPLGMRLETSLMFWLILNPFAVGALLWLKNPRWMVLGFSTGCIFIFTSTAYSHYFVPIVPFAALLGAPLASRIVRVSRTAIVLGSFAIAAAWSTGIGALASQPGYVTSRFSQIQPAVRLIDRITPPGTPILADGFEYSFLAGRPWVAHYFWNDQSVVSAQYLEKSLTHRTVIARYPDRSRIAYPHGLTNFLSSHYVQMRVGGTVLWLVGRRQVAELDRRQVAELETESTDAVQYPHHLPF
jgi:Dolichyl-phosphate-mannose-protein mannosyltransferase